MATIFTLQVVVFTRWDILRLMSKKMDAVRDHYADLFSKGNALVQKNRRTLKQRLRVAHYADICFAFVLPIALVLEGAIRCNLPERLPQDASGLPEYALGMLLLYLLPLWEEKRLIRIKANKLADFSGVPLGEIPD